MLETINILNSKSVMSFDNAIISKTCTMENSREYLFGFNGKEKDDEVHGASGTCYDYGFRIYDPRIARFLSVDPLTKSYPWYTPYQFAGNNPILFIDVDGLERAVSDQNLTGEDFVSPVLNESIKEVQIQYNLEKLIGSANNALDNAWKKSHLKNGNVEEHGGLFIDRTNSTFYMTMDGLVYSFIQKNTFVDNEHTDHDPGKVSINNKIEYNETILGDYHTHIYSNSEINNSAIPFNDKGEGVPQSGGDFAGLSKQISLDIANEGYCSLVEAGNKRFALVITDKAKAQTFITKTEIDNYIFKQLKGGNGSFDVRVRQGLIDALKTSEDSGLKLYETVDKEKKTFEKVE